MRAMSFLCFQDKSRDCDMETGENKSDGSKGENPPGDNVKIPPTNAKAPSAEPELPELPEVKFQDTDRQQDRMDWFIHFF